MPRHKIYLVPFLLPLRITLRHSMLHTCHDEFTQSHCYTRMYFRVYEALVVDAGYLAV
jgi:hypothetical protein